MVNATFIVTIVAFAAGIAFVASAIMESTSGIADLAYIIAITLNTTVQPPTTGISTINAFNADGLFMVANLDPGGMAIKEH